MSLNVPQIMPILSFGGHSSPTEGACIMELASFLAGEEWSDEPECVHPLLAKAARVVNDDVSREERQGLLPLLPRLMGTSDVHEATSDAIRDGAAKYVEHLAGHVNRSVTIAAETAASSKNPGVVVWEAQVAVALSGMDQIAFLSALIDAYDKAVGRTEPAVVTEDDLRRCAELTGAKA